MSDPTSDVEIEPLNGPVDATVVVPGSKSITNRALLIAALAAQPSELTGVLFADDTEAMLGALSALGAELIIDRDRHVVRVVRGIDFASVPADTVLNSLESGTSARFLVAVAALASAPVTVDGQEAIRVRPIADLAGALEQLGVVVTSPAGGEEPRLPLTIDGSESTGGKVSLRGDASSQFLSALMMSGPMLKDGLEIELTTPLVSRPYVVMTAEVMAAFGAVATIGGDDDAPVVRVESGGYTGTDFEIEPDASAASYFFAAAAVCGGRVRVEGLGSHSLQGDLAFVELLGQMGAEVTVGEHYSEVRAASPVSGLEVDLADCSDLAPSLAVVAATATTPSRVTGIGFIRHKESDRVGGVVAELLRCGVGAIEEDDGFVIEPAPVRPATIETYGDHRMAMSFAVLGLANAGIRISNPGCVAKTYPNFFADLDQLRKGSGGASVT